MVAAGIPAMRIQDTLIERGHDKQEVFAIVDQVLAMPVFPERELREQEARRARARAVREVAAYLASWEFRSLTKLIVIVLTGMVVAWFQIENLVYKILVSVGLFALAVALAVFGYKLPGKRK
jgi:hypothetical protein